MYVSISHLAKPILRGLEHNIFQPQENLLCILPDLKMEDRTLTFKGKLFFLNVVYDLCFIWL